MIKIPVAPLSANRLWRGRKFKTQDYQIYEQEVLYRLAKTVLQIDFTSIKKLTFFLKVGLSSKNSDLSNTIKALEDILQHKFSFNDKNTYMIIAEKEIVKKGQEYIAFDFLEYDIGLFDYIKTISTT